MTMLIVTHEMDFAMSISDRVIFMENGNIQLDAAPETILCDAQGERVRRFMGIAARSPRPSATVDLA
ncbi:Glutamine transport ATP-binding protein GlnQ [compost metagenome]